MNSKTENKVEDIESEEEEEEVYVPFSKRPEWSDVTPIEQDDGTNPICPIAYSDLFKDKMNYFRAIIKSGEKSKRVIDLIDAIIEDNPSNYTVWYYRREVLKSIEFDIEEEFYFVGTMGESDPKNYQIWNHRRYLVETYKDSSRELEFVADRLFEDAKNYHAWAHRQWVMTAFNLWDQELPFVESLLKLDHRNNSAWNQRFFVIEHKHRLPLPLPVLESEIATTLSFIRISPNNESPWSYLRVYQLTNYIYRRMPTPLFKYQCEFMSNIKVISLTVEIPESERKRKLDFSPFSKKRSNIGLLISYIDIVHSSSSYSFKIDIDLPLQHIIPDIRNNYTNFYPNQKDASSLSINIPYSFAVVEDENFNIKLNRQDDYESRLTKNTEDQVDRLRQYLSDLNQQNNNSNKDNNNNSIDKSFIICRLCLNSIIEYSGISSIKCLPSSSWSELADVWLCGCTGTSQFKGLPNELSSIKDQCLVGDTSILMHRFNLFESNIVTIDSTTTTTTATIISNQSNHDNDHSNSNHLYKIIQCKHCSQQIGLIHGDNCKIDKHRVATRSLKSFNNDDSNNYFYPGIDNIFSVNTIETVFSSLILNESHMTAIYKFLLVAPDHNRQCFLRLTLQSWDTFILFDNDTNKDSTIDDDASKFLPIIKIRYQIVNKKNVDINTGNNNGKSNELLDDDSFNIISLPLVDCFEIVNLLESNHSKLSKQRLLSSSSLTSNNNNNNNNNKNSGVGDESSSYTETTPLKLSFLRRI
ncbi:protein prenyltransferase alpha subunit [Heterostelium album PN500]|uniref:Protein farnesyltransferase/geranylgeranyltransferase type-1 subunit alpha n=1 Tax=Heterostelium pallidum (strain ATCC 26659 / Pp 5 / PN500) TaxID=670386 RepID=D3B7R8_HETP5|nr:protein prenyltransferase alpha subunit [Heterostelium album PN500]EFA82811.1 protein prenyltransferase alpha subunit [Heterostelium album PN500]|eukprot:XP_020434928.1 protein prenyltransferase alpha subunit [Heterostelium album PN500]